MTDEATKKSPQELADDELNGRVGEFNKELVPLLGKYELGLGASAYINPNGTIAARPIMFDARKAKEAAPAEAKAANDVETAAPKEPLSEG